MAPERLAGTGWGVGHPLAQQVARPRRFFGAKLATRGRTTKAPRGVNPERLKKRPGGRDPHDHAAERSNSIRISTVRKPRQARTRLEDPVVARRVV